MRNDLPSTMVFDDAWNRQQQNTTILQDPFSARTGVHYGQNTVQGFVDGAFITVGTASAGVPEATGIKRFTRYTAVNSGDNAGQRGQGAVTIRGYDPYLKVNFRSSQTGQRYYIGFWSNTGGADPAGDDPLNAFQGFMLCGRSTDTVWQIAHNDGTGATVFNALTGPNLTIDNNARTIELFADTANNRWGYIWENPLGAWTGKPTWITTEIPAVCTMLAFVIQMESSSAGLKTFDIGKWIVRDRG